MCRAMDGVTVALDEPFMYQGQVVELSSGERYINNYAAMDTPNAHQTINALLNLLSNN